MFLLRNVLPRPRIDTAERNINADAHTIEAMEATLEEFRVLSPPASLWPHTAPPQRHRSCWFHINV